jgi:uncharacterized protein
LSNSLSPLRLNVGFFLNQNIGYSRGFPFDVPKIHLPPDLDLTDLTGTARITRTPQGLLVQVKVHAVFRTECGRCLTSFNQPLDSEFTELYAFSSKFGSTSDLIFPEDGHIDLEPLVREYLFLAIPITPLCKPDCKGLCLVCGENLNESPHSHDTKEGDYRP